MGLEKQSKVVGEFEYTVTQLGAKMADRVLLKIMKSVAPVFLVMGAARNGGKIDVAGALAALSEEDFEWVRDRLAESTDVQLDKGAPRLLQIYDAHFRGKTMERVEWLEFAIEVNYGPFFRELKERAAVALASDAGGATKTPSSSTSPSTSAGEPSESSPAGATT